LAILILPSSLTAFINPYDGAFSPSIIRYIDRTGFLLTISSTNGFI
jgi:hypothetical protein